jgi:two-component system sensor histidine kinase KdpD
MRRAGGYLAAVALVLAANGAAFAASPRLSGGNLAMLFLTAVLVAAVGFGLGPALLGAFLAGISYNFFFLEPRFTFWIGHPADLLTFSTFFAVALATGWLAGQVRDHQRATARRAAVVQSLLDASRALSAAATPEETSQALAAQVSAVTGGAAVVLLPERAGMRLAGGPAGIETLGKPSVAAARRVWDTGEAGRTWDAARHDDGWAFRPLDGVHGRVGVIGLRGADDSTGGDGRLAALLQQGAVALERAALATAAAENQALRRSDQLRSALLNSISHDFRTPLSTVLGSATTLLDYDAKLKPSVRRDLLESIRDDAQQLNRYVGDLLDMGRLEGGALEPRKEWVDVREVLASAIGRLGERLARGRILRDFAPELSLLELDPVLLEQALLNILANAAAYSPDDAPIDVAVHEDHDHVLVSIEDAGPGIPPDQLQRVFDKFRRLASGDGGTGVGLGLSIAKGFVEAMGGRIAAASPIADGHGTRFLVALPKGRATPRDLL